MSDIEKQLEYTLSANEQAPKTKVPRKENINLIHNALSGAGETYDIIMEKTGLTRPTVTKYLEKLGQMGIVRSEGKKPKLFYPIKDESGEAVGASSGGLIQPDTIEVGQKPDKIERDVLDYEVLQEMGNYALDKKVSDIKIGVVEGSGIYGSRLYVLRVDGSTKPKKRELVAGSLLTIYGKELLEFDDEGVEVGRVPKVQVESMSFFDLVQVVSGKVILTPTGFKAKKSLLKWPLISP